MYIPGSVLLFWAKIVEIYVAEVGTKKKRHLLFATELFTLELCFYIYCISEFWHTGDNVRLSDVVKFTVNLDRRIIHINHTKTVYSSMISFTVLAETEDLSHMLPV